MKASPQNKRRVLFRCTRGTMAVTMAQAFLGALTVGVGLSRGVEADLGFHVETLSGESNYAASRVAAGHARASNAIADNNVVSVAAMAPRLAVESDNITMDETSKIACPQQMNPQMKKICDDYQRNKPRAQAKLQWIREKQKSLWGSLEKLSGDMNKVAGAHARDEVKQAVAKADPTSQLKFDDPTESKDTWGKKNASTACSLAKKDALGTQMVGHAFPTLMQNLLESLPKALVSTLPSAMCPSSAESGPLQLGDVPTVNAEANEECDRIQQEMQDQADASTSGAAASTTGSRAPVFSSDVEPFVTCSAGGAGKGPQRMGAGAIMMRKNGRAMMCSFDRAACTKKKLETGSANFLKSLGLSSIPSFGGIGGSTRAPSASNPNASDDFRSCASAERPVDGGTADIAEAARALVTFGGTTSSSPLRSSAKRESCGKWYFPTGGGSSFAGVSKDHQSFVSAWKHALVAPRSGGQSR